MITRAIADREVQTGCGCADILVHRAAATEGAGKRIDSGRALRIGFACECDLGEWPMRRATANGLLSLLALVACIWGIARRRGGQPGEAVGGNLASSASPPIVQRSPDRRIAIAAVVVTGIVGVAAPLITWQAGASAHREAAAAERQRTDRVELRAVLDEALVALTSFQSSVLSASTTWWSLERTASGLTVLPEASLERPLEAFESARGGSERIRIRLGPRHEAAQLHSRATGDLFQALQVMQLAPPDEDAKKSFWKYWGAATSALNELRSSMFKIAETRVS
jgi:hypothetical protein